MKLDEIARLFENGNSNFLTSYCVVEKIYKFRERDREKENLKKVCYKSNYY